jgi:molybdate transport system substrate-binding protein
MAVRFIVATLLVIYGCHSATAAEIRVLSAAAVKETALELIPEFEKGSGHSVKVTWSGTADIKKRIAAGEEYDLVIVPSPEIDKFIKSGAVVAGSRVDLVKSGIGIGVGAGAPKPDISTAEALKAALLAAKSIGYSTGASGDYLKLVLQRMGIADQVNSKLKQTPSGIQIGSLLTSGEAQIGFQQISELIDFPGVDYVGPLPAGIQEITVFSAGLQSSAKQPTVAIELVKFLTAPAAAPTIKKHGMEPG